MARVRSFVSECGIVLAAVFSLRAAGQSPAPAPTSPPLAPIAPAPQAIPDPAHVSAAVASYRHPLFRPVDAPARLLDKGILEDWRSRVSFVVAVRLDDTGKVISAEPVEPPLKALTAPIPALVPRWRFTPARKGTQTVATWATFGLELDVELDKGLFSQFDIKPLEREDALPLVASEHVGDTWLSRYPSAIDPAEPGVVSVEEADVLPTPQKASWSIDAARVKTRVRAYVEVSAQGTTTRLVAVGTENEPLAVAWVRKAAARWRFAPAQAGGAPVASWLSLDATLEFTLDSAKEKGKRSIKKNVRGTPAA